MTVVRLNNDLQRAIKAGVLLGCGAGGGTILSKFMNLEYYFFFVKRGEC